jgi:hypothetical protein
MSRLPRTNHESVSSKDIYSQYNARESIDISTYPYSSRYIQGEPDCFPWQAPDPAAIPVVTSISPHEMHRTPYPTGIRPSAITDNQRRCRSDSEYVKRPRRRAEEVDRLYSCTWLGCDKAYGALNHLNTHVRNAGHGPKREPKGKFT